jgi:hypothetical protein
MVFTDGGFAPPRLAAYEVSVIFTTDRIYRLCYPSLARRTDEGVRPYTIFAGGIGGLGNGRLTVEGTAAFATQHTFVLLALR